MVWRQIYFESKSSVSKKRRHPQIFIPLILEARIRAQCAHVFFWPSLILRNIYIEDFKYVWGKFWFVKFIIKLINIDMMKIYIVQWVENCSLSWKFDKVLYKIFEWKVKSEKKRDSVVERSLVPAKWSIYHSRCTSRYEDFYFVLFKNVYFQKVFIFQIWDLLYC